MAYEASTAVGPHAGTDLDLDPKDADALRAGIDAGIDVLEEIAFGSFRDLPPKTPSW
jgi:hypothetical protein